MDTARRRAALAMRARRQDGLFTAEQARTLGFARSTVARWVRSGRCRRWHPGVLSDAALPVTWSRRVRAGQLAYDPGSVIVASTAAALHELAGVSPGLIELAVARTRRMRLPGIVVHRPLRMPPSQVIDGLCVATVPAAVLGLAQERDRRALEEVVADAVRRRLTTVREVAEHVHANGPTVAGRRRLLDALDHLGLGESLGSGEAASGRRSSLETGFARLLDRYGLPQPSWGHPVIAGDRRYELDAWWPAQRIAVELDGHRFHATPGELQHDSRRQNDLVLAGVALLLRFTWEDVRGRPDETARQVAGALARLRR